MAAYRGRSTWSLDPTLATTQTFRASPTAYVVPCVLMLIPLVLLLLISIRDSRPQIALILMILLFLVTNVVAARVLKLTFDDRALIYRRLFAGTRRVEYADIIAVHSISKFMGGFGPFVGVELKLRSGDKVEILCKVFPRAAYTALLALKPLGSN